MNHVLYMQTNGNFVGTFLGDIPDPSRRRFRLSGGSPTHALDITALPAATIARIKADPNAWSYHAVALPGQAQRAQLMNKGNPAETLDVKDITYRP